MIIANTYFMRKYLIEHEAIIDLHERGYTEDFSLSGNDLLWLQGKTAVRAGEFSIVEFHSFPLQADNRELIVYGIHVFSHNIKGILITSVTGQSSTPPVIIKKTNELALC